jgi:hypothetical protein
VSRSSRTRSRAPQAGAAVAYALGVVALLIQITLPWLEGLHAQGARGFVTTTAVGITPYAHDEAIGSHAKSVSRPHWARHDDEACPVCRLIGQSRSGIVLATESVAGVQLSEAVSAAPPSITLPTAFRTAASPRAPPRSLA